MAWSARHISRSNITTDITAYVTPEALGVSASASPSGGTFAIPMIGEPFQAQIGARVEILDGSDTVVTRGWIESIDRGDAGPVAGLAQQTTLYCADIFSLLRRTYVPQVADISSQQAYDQERPSGFRERVDAYDPDPAGTLNLTKAGMYGWALGLIENLEAAKGGARIPAISTGTSYVSSYPSFTFDSNFPIVADGQSYWSLIDGIAQISGQGWTIEPSGGAMVLRTWDLTAVQSESVADYEISDDPDVSPVVGGNTIVASNTLSITEDASGVVNKVQVVWGGKSTTGRTSIKSIDLPGEGLTTGVFDTAASVAAYGERFERLTSEFTTKAKAIAIASRKIGSSKNANNRGTARVPYLGALNIRPGYWVWVHRTGHPGTHAGHWDGLAWLQSVTPVFERGESEPIWLELEFTHNTYEPSAFRPFVAPQKPPAPPVVDVDTGVTDDVPGNSDPGNTGPELINPTPTTSPLPATGDVFITPLTHYYNFFDKNMEYSAASISPLSSAPIVASKVGWTTGLTNWYPSTRPALLPQYEATTAAGDSISGAVISAGLFGVFPMVPSTTYVDGGRVFLCISVPGPTYSQATRIRIAQIDPVGPSDYTGANLTLAASNWAIISAGLAKNGKEFALAPGTNRIELPFTPKKHTVPSNWPHAGKINGKWSAVFAAQIVSQKDARTAGQSKYQCRVEFGSGWSISNQDQGWPAIAPRIFTSATAVQPYRVNRSNPQQVYPGLTGTGGATGINIDASKRQLTTAHCYALINVDKGSTWSSATSSQITQKLGGSRGKVQYVLSQPAKPRSVSVYLCDTRYSFAPGSPGTRDISRRVVLLKNTSGQVTGFDITPVQSYGLVPKQYLMAVFVPA